MAFTDPFAAHMLRELRLERGLSPEALALEIRNYVESQPWGGRGAVDAHTIRRIERRHHVPGPRVQFVLSSYFGKTMREIWEPGKQAPVEAAA